jgi:LPS O-antigen subunit length determinant protein (WzzB/FepE family)
MNENEMRQTDEISLFDLWTTLRKGWLAVFSAVLLGIAGATLAIFLSSPKYEAVALVQVGQVGQVGQVAQVGLVGQVSSLPVEPTQQVSERMKTPTFQMAIAQATRNQSWIDLLTRSGGAAGDYLTLSIAKATIGQGVAPLLELRTKADSPDRARGIAEVAINELSKRQAEIARPAIERMQGELAIAKEKRKSAESDLESLGKLLAATGVKDDRFTQLSLMNSLRLQKESELFFQRRMVATLEAALSAPATQSARAIEAVFVSDKPVSPKKTLLLALGIIGGLLAGMLWVFGSASWRVAQKQRKANN